MTPFGRRLRELRAERNITQKQMANALGVSPAYLSALEHGKRGSPRWILVQEIISFLGVIWDDADELQRLAARSVPKVTIDTSDLSPTATELANLLSMGIGDFSEAQLQQLRDRLEAELRNANPDPTKGRAVQLPDH
ncbi:MAG: helix-turn-helix transcriptional regulator [Pseudomonadota bacterium]